MNPDSPQQPAREALALVQGHMEAVRQLLSRMRPEELSLVQARYPQLPQLLGIPAELGGAAAAATDPREVDARPQTHNEGDGAFPTADDEAAAGSGVFGVGDQEEQGTPPGTPRESSPTAPPAPVRKPQPRTGPPRVPEEGSGLGKRPSDTRPSSEATPSGKAAAVAHESDAERIAGTAVAPGNPVESAGGVVRDDTATCASAASSGCCRAPSGECCDCARICLMGCDGSTGCTEEATDCRRAAGPRPHWRRRKEGLRRASDMG